MVSGVGETSIILCLYMYLQICQAENVNSSNTFTIANGSEQIMINPSDSRGQMYLRYTGPGEPGSGVAGPRYETYTRSYIIYSRMCTNEVCCITVFLHHHFTESLQCICTVTSHRPLLLPLLGENLIGYYTM